MTKTFALVAAAPKAAEGKLNFLSTQSTADFAANYCDPGTKVSVIKNPKPSATSKHPGHLFITWKKDGQTFNGSVSSKLVTPEDFANAKLVISVISSPKSPEDYGVLLHTEAERNNDNTLLTL